MHTPDQSPSKWQRYLYAAALLPLAIIIAWLAALPGAFFSPGSWYAALEKPSWNPPNQIFGPVWSLLYTMMGISSWMVWLRRAVQPIGKALGLYGVQLFLNALWTVCFFGLQSPSLALINIAVLLLFIIWSIIEFYRISIPAALMLVPYLLWVGFATILNTGIWWLN